MAHFNSMPVMIRGRLYASQRNAAAALGITQSAISRMLAKKGDLSNAGLGPTGAPGNQSAARPLQIGPVTFPSRIAAAKSLGISRCQLQRWISPKASPAQRERLIGAVMRLSDSARAARR